MAETFYGEIVKTPIDNTLTLARCWKEEYAAVYASLNVLAIEAVKAGAQPSGQMLGGMATIVALWRSIGMTEQEIDELSERWLRKAKEICGG